MYCKVRFFHRDRKEYYYRRMFEKINNAVLKEQATKLSFGSSSAVLWQ